MLLEEVLGQDAAKAVIRRAVAAGRVAHAYLFEGPPGVGKHAAAVGLALLLNCERIQTAPPEAARQTTAHDAGAAGQPVACGRCEPCRRILAGIHPDVLTVVPAGAQLLMEQAQDIVALVQTRPHEARARVVIIDDADRMNANASNCLLKTLEEPSARTHLILVTAAPERLLGTIRSRTQRVRFRGVSPGILLELAERRGLDAGEARVASAMAEGRVGRFLELLAAAEPQPAAGGQTAAEGVETGKGRAPGGASPADAPKDASKSGSKTKGKATKRGDDEEDDEGAVSAAETQRMVAALRTAARSRDVVTLFDTAAALGDKTGKASLPDVLAILARLYRDAVAIRSGAAELALFTPETAGDLAPPVGLPLPTLGRALDVIVEAGDALAGNVNAVMALERMLIHLNRAERAPSRGPAP